LDCNAIEEEEEEQEEEEQEEEQEQEEAEAERKAKPDTVFKHNAIKTNGKISNIG
jgi:hypothetical protein